MEQALAEQPGGAAGPPPAEDDRCLQAILTSGQDADIDLTIKYL